MMRDEPLDELGIHIFDAASTTAQPMAEVLGALDVRLDSMRGVATSMQVLDEGTEVCSEKVAFDASE
jgi:hypothetical protein